MPRALALLGSGRREGYTATLMLGAVEGMKEVSAVDVEIVYLHDYVLAPCRSCFECIRAPDHFCVREDEMGKRGEGALFRKIRDANGLLLCDPVHLYGPSAQTHLFVERCYPFLWSGDLIGLPFASISCATNQGMQRIATRELCKWAFGFGMRYIGGLSVHASYFARGVSEARSLGRSLAEAVRADSTEGKKRVSDTERFRSYTQTPWSILEAYVDNLSDGTSQWEHSLIAEAERSHSFSHPESISLMRKAAREFRAVLRAYRSGDRVAASDHLARCSSFWTHATWKEFLESDVIGTAPPKAYRPLDSGE